jgi:hypothetical protein
MVNGNMANMRALQTPTAAVRPDCTTIVGFPDDGT